MFVSRIQMPSGVQDVMDMMNNMIGPIGMLLAGMVIADVPLKIVFTKKRNYLSTVLRLIVLSNICTDSNETDSYICRNK